MLAILALSVLLAGFLLWAIRFIHHPTARTLLRVFVGLCLAAVVVFLVLAWGFPTSLLVQSPTEARSWLTSSCTMSFRV